MAIDRTRFFSTVRPMFGGRLTQSQVDGMNAILDGWEARMPNEDMRWLAYMLATAFHETRFTMKPVREAFWLSEDWRRRNLPYYPYYGRGYVQLTHRTNYLKAGNFVGDDLVSTPDLALRPDHAAIIMFIGMTEGWFRRDQNGVPHTLKRYFNNTVDDPIRARRIINGYEEGVAEDIAEYHKVFLRALGAQVFRDTFADEIFEASHLETIANIDQPFTRRIRPLMEMPTEHALTDTRQMVTEIVSAYVSNNEMAPEALPDLVTNVYLALSLATNVNSRVTDDYDETEPEADAAIALDAAKRRRGRRANYEKPNRPGADEELPGVP